jgi:hypothetical protein
MQPQTAVCMQVEQPQQSLQTRIFFPTAGVRHTFFCGQTFLLCCIIRLTERTSSGVCYGMPASGLGAIGLCTALSTRLPAWQVIAIHAHEKSAWASASMMVGRRQHHVSHSVSMEAADVMDLIIK